MLLALIVVALLVICAWVWMNIWLVRRRRENTEVAAAAATENLPETPAAGQADVHAAATQPDRGSSAPSVAPGGAETASPAWTEEGPPAPDAAAAGPAWAEAAVHRRPRRRQPAVVVHAPPAETGAVDGTGRGTTGQGAAEAGKGKEAGTKKSADSLVVTDKTAAARADRVEVVSTPAPGRGVFAARRPPFLLYEANAPQLAAEPWLACYTALTADERVLGWAAFAGEALGAADRVYEPALLDGLRAHWRSAQRLRKEAGLSRVLETSLTGDEGRVWMLAAVDDVWLALFVEADADLQGLSQQLLAAAATADAQADVPVGV
ncbi:MAG: hypothetical protein K6T26_00105 [Alicyclobacillus sp.]|nr:hypothetical protein [Alicyclobacillus sp.]